MTNIFTRVLLFVTCVVLVAPALAEKRVALVIGNSAYKHAPALANPKNDAEGVAAALARLKFEVLAGTDLDKAATERLLHAFARAIEAADVALVFYAGHGLQVHGRNYLVPVDGRLEREADLPFQAVPLDLVQGLMEQGQRTNIMILDACRDNPLARNLARTMGTRSTAIGRGLGETKAGVGTLIVYATQPGNVALDGEGRHSPFTLSLLKHIEAPGLEIRQVLSRVRNEVISATREKQVPWDSSSLRGDFFFKAAAAAPEPSPPPPPLAPQPRPAAPSAEYETLFWQSIKDSRSIGDFRAYLERWPNGVFAPLARIRIAALERAAGEDEARRRAAEEQAKSEAEAKRKADTEAKARADAEARRKAEDDRKKAEEAQPDPRKQAQTANSWYAPERKRGLIAFAHGKATLEPGAVAALERLAASLQNQKDYRIALVASVDRTEAAAAALQSLSRARLAAIQQWLAGQGVAASAMRVGIGAARGEGPEHRIVSVAVETAAPAKRDEAPAAPAADIAARLVGMQWGGTLSGTSLKAIQPAWPYSSFVRFQPNGVVAVITSPLAGGNTRDSTGHINADDRGAWTASGNRVCVKFGRIAGGEQVCYTASAHADGSITLSGAGLLNGKRFSK